LAPHFRGAGKAQNKILNLTVLRLNNLIIKEKQLQGFFLFPVNIAKKEKASGFPPYSENRWPAAINYSYKAEALKVRL